MNKIKSTITAAITLTLLAGTSFTSSAMDKYIEDSLIEVCKASTTNSMLKFNKTMKSYRLNNKAVANKVMCNGDDITDFARNHGSYKVAAKLEKSLNGNVSITDVAALSKIDVKFVE
ncbi:DUF3718 domain-containing protein [Thalassotalea castellviae]|uniref:DUF3718 domain-containing protein n=1 Tax=Thalassotalea castellviae TaxID=3075612 RepID=A0ABU2ZZV4_9GAMM|nr:DUF3718 domain-containing protein [Thalassotalea sp. W431]MDT0603459.1 DUF3718 domain-containing protein [Thalassotalea sp. W431]